MGTGITGVQASGHTPTWIFPLADLTTPITDETTEIPLSVITGAVKADCYWDMGDFSISRTATTRSMRRACMKAAVERKTGETRTVTLPNLVSRPLLSNPSSYDQLDLSQLCLVAPSYDPPLLYRIWLG